MVIYQKLLDRIAQAMETQRFDLYQTYFALPQTIETFGNRRVIADVNELRQIFDTLCAKLDDDGNSSMIRHCISAEFTDGTTIHGSHETRIIGHGVQINASYLAYSVLRLEQGDWRVVSSQYADVADSFVDEVFDHGKS